MAKREDPLNRFHGLDQKSFTQEEQEEIIRLALNILKRRYRPGQLLTTPTEVSEFLRLHLQDKTNEIFGCIFLSTRHHIIEVADLFQGTVDGASVHPRVILQKALEINAAALVLFHNHPSGVAEPSADDRRITEKVRDAAAYLDIRVLDHLIVGATEVVSMAERGLF